MNGPLLGTLALATGAILALACGGAASDPAASAPEGGRGVIGGTDTDRRSVPLSDIHFDTFAGGSIPLSSISDEDLLDLRDRIPPLDNPLYEPVEGGDWLGAGDLVVGYVAADGQAYAYPTKILNFHEIVNDDLAGEPVLISYCPLCRSAVVYDRRLDGQVLSFGNTSALYQSDLVMYDRETLSYWFQVGGEAIVGDLTGERLTALPSLSTTWDEWRRLHPDTLVLSRDTGHVRNYERDPFVGLGDAVNAGDIPFPVTEAAGDERLEPAALVVGVELDGEARAYPVGLIGDAAVADTLGGEPIAVFSLGTKETAAAFRSELDGRMLTFEFRDGRFLDKETESEWSLAGEAVAGPLEGARLEPLPSRTTFWFAYIAAFPEATVFGE